MSHSKPTHHNGDEYDPNNPHGFTYVDHGHHVMSGRTLLLVLLALLAFTGLTVGAAEVETYMIEVMGWNIPHWANVIIAMTIATVKAFLVVTFFMALKYDNPLNTIVFLFCLFAFAIFLSFTALDLGNRDRVEAYRAQQITAGGTGVNLTRKSGEVDEHGNPRVENIVGPIAGYVRNVTVEKKGADYVEKKLAEKHPHHEDAAVGPNRSRPQRGLSGALDEHAPAPDAAHGGH
ncbi:MAG: hypothetical protein DYG93_05605 [Leptolyngbya sp. PLA2]|nr:hypothetical protein [Leptolyngbya sp.]MCE7971124.1 hypothetical protein [Leptolyngbya sp. PL-A2]MCQ3940803.1 hypothetical protein [cyanobacterium CYA1]MCZ7634178.1 cytochrome C oxidase subunit IV family protein [Phycisphaerales bacterium]MDL1905118.1 hypothetical protein [Synechococcales cyanobacterium CNB]GIK19335.1 MAG: hypothetical protein BroJett004_14990 [Planctomycetota bacterium]